MSFQCVMRSLTSFEITDVALLRVHQNPERFNNIMEIKKTDLIESLEKLDVHDHLCLIYETHQEQFAAVIPFIRIGLQRGEKCIYIADDNTTAQVLQAMREDAIDVDTALASGSLQVLTSKESYLKGGFFDPDRMISLLKETTNKALADGFSALRVTGEMTWALSGEKGADRLIEYENKLNYFFPKHRCLGICQYNAGLFSPGVILDVIFSHPKIIYGELVCDNFYYIKPEEAQSPLSPDRQLEMVKRFLFEIQKRKQTENTLRSKETQYRSFFENFRGIGYRLSDDRYSPLFMSGDVERITGYTADAFMSGNITWNRLVHPDDMPLFVVELNKILTLPGYVADTRYRIFAKDGSVHWVRDIAYQVPEQESSIQGTVYDITKAKTLQDELFRLRTAIEQSTGTVMILDKAGSIQYVNHALEEITGFTREELVGKKIEPFSKNQPEMFNRIWPVVMRGANWKGNIYILGKDKSEVVLEVSVSPFRDESGRLTGFLSIGRDVRREKELESQLLQSQKMEALGVLAGGIAHDFNNILSSIIGYTQLCLRMPDKKGHLFEKDLNEVLKAGGRAQELVKQILLFSKGGEGAEEKKVFQLSIIINEVLKLMRGSIPSTIEIQSFIKSNACVLADPTRIHQVMVNLCTNAVYAMKDSVGVLRVELVDEIITDQSLGVETGSFVKITVSDTGCGMSDDLCRRIFEPFFTTKQTGDGTGLGLSVAYGIARDCRGTITVQSIPGKGSIFNVYLPAVDEHHASDETEDKVAPRGNGELILLVDDELIMLNMGKRVLEEIGYRVETCINPVQALDMFKNRSGEFSLVLTDLTMPKMTGDMLVGEMRKIQKDIPVVMFTGYGVEVLKERAVLAGVNYFITKPFGQFEIADIIRKALDDGKEGMSGKVRG